MAPKRKPVGISPKLLFEQVLSTAPWSPAITPKLPALAVLERAPELETRWKNGEDTEEYFVFLLAAHFTTVATFVPTDVDQRIRALTWAPLTGRRLSSAVDRTLEVATWDMRPVSERTVTIGDEVLAGHHGEWLSVMAGALGRALVLADAPVVTRATDFIEAELVREAKLIALARKKKTDPRTLLSVVTTVAHNLGDLSRVVDTWKPEHAESELGLRFRRLGHEGGSLRYGEGFAYAGDLNKRLMAIENHRFLPLRVPRALRRSRELLLPFGPYFFEWGQRIASTTILADPERAEILLALLRIHERRAEELGCLRAIAGMHGAFPGGVERLAKLLPANETSALRKPAVRDALRTTEKDFLKDFHAAVTR
ncbi:MAG: hypothetical protein JWP97_2688 [Labilithrix sp.]|nr:hypothetical protein [Labilithrix sp.]